MTVRFDAPAGRPPWHEGLPPKRRPIWPRLKSALFWLAVIAIGSGLYFGTYDQGYRAGVAARDSAWLKALGAVLAPKEPV